MKIYTKKGDKGKTSLLGGTRLPKHHIRIEAYGSVDELNSFIGFLRDLPIKQHQIENLICIQNLLFTIGSNLAADPKRNKFSLPALKDSNISDLEKWIDRMNEVLPEMKNFVLPGGNQAVSACHIARSVCRRAERNIVHLSEIDFVEPMILKFMNRLSDYLFVLSRQISFENNIQEIIWKSNI